MRTFNAVSFPGPVSLRPQVKSLLNSNSEALGALHQWIRNCRSGYSGEFRFSDIKCRFLENSGKDYACLKAFKRICFNPPERVPFSQRPSLRSGQTLWQEKRPKRPFVTTRPLVSVQMDSVSQPTPRPIVSMSLRLDIPRLVSRIARLRFASRT